MALAVAVIAGVVIAPAIIAVRPADGADAGATPGSPEGHATSPPPWSAGRVEMPWAGVAVTFPDDWVVDVTPEALPRTRMGRMLGPALPIFPVLARAIAPDYQQRLESCNLVSFDLIPRWQPLPLTTSDVAESLATLPLPDPDSGFGWGEIDLPAGDASHLIHREGGSGETDRPVNPAWRLIGRERVEGQVEDRVVFHSAFVVAREPGYVWLWCTSLDEAPDDLWLSIAETIEFLPVGE